MITNQHSKRQGTPLKNQDAHHLKQVKILVHLLLSRLLFAGEGEGQFWPGGGDRHLTQSLPYLAKGLSDLIHILKLDPSNGTKESFGQWHWKPVQKCLFKIHWHSIGTDVCFPTIKTSDSNGSFGCPWNPFNMPSSEKFTIAERHLKLKSLIIISSHLLESLYGEKNTFLRHTSYLSQAPQAVPV